ncbi:hypothetical protein O6H91_18G035100 [Diphasiastrum complanatum]|uniref:Uncharacterized protein n=2 Tax=Diphasiastrum complanatum TaxID=34168 RepID=A0ACC2AZQ5_DIPCM|nr:hypothetical protein O6H91_18G035100 [Diphasiastrum complanatum]
MKRQLGQDSEGQEGICTRKRRRVSEDREQEQEHFFAADLDLNASPKDLDLNTQALDPEGSGHDTEFSHTPQQINSGEENQDAQLVSVSELDSQQEQQLLKEGDSNDKEQLENCFNKQASQCAIDPTQLTIVAALPIRQVDPVIALGINDDLEVLWSVWGAWIRNEVQEVDNILANLCEELHRNPFAPCRYLYLSSFYISKKIPEAFRLPRTFHILLKFLSPRELQPGIKRQPILPILACKLLFRAFSEETEWPLIFIKAYLEDAIGPRVWIEHDSCKEFVLILLKAFCFEDGIAVANRYSNEEVRKRVHAEYLQALDKMLVSSLTNENLRHLLKFLTQGAAYEEVRVVGSTMLEGWLNNPVHVRAAKSLLNNILYHINGISLNEFSTVANLLALRLNAQEIKFEPGSIYFNIITQLVQRRSEYRLFVLKKLFTAETKSKDYHNIKSIATALKALDGSHPEQEFSLVLKELAANEEPQSQLVHILRRILREVGSHMDTHALCQALLEPWPVLEKKNDLLKKVWSKQIVDLACEALLHSGELCEMDENLLSAINCYTSDCTPLSGERLAHLETFCFKAANFQVEAITWCTDVLLTYVPSIGSSELACFLKKLLFLEDAKVYVSNPDCDKLDLILVDTLSSCAFASEEILARLILMGISDDYPLSQQEALGIIESIVWRATLMQKLFGAALLAENAQFKDLYWQACLMVVAIGACNPTTIGKSVWDNIPIIRYLMKALMTCSTSFASIICDLELAQPSAEEQQEGTSNVKTEEVISASVLERGFQPDTTTGSASFLTEDWKENLLFLDRIGAISRPPDYICKELEDIEKIYHLGSMLRKCRHPDFLAEIASSQTFSQAWPWIHKILVTEPDVIVTLPPVWQVELLYEYDKIKKAIPKGGINPCQLRENLQRLIIEGDRDEKVLEPIVTFLAHKLHSKHNNYRVRARCCFQDIFKPILMCQHASYGEDAMQVMTGMDQDMGTCHYPVVNTYESSTSDAGTEAEIEFYTPENCTWLEFMENLSPTSATLKLLVFSLQLAMQQEISVKVVDFYLKFLMRLSLSLPDKLLLACSIASFLLKRKMLAEIILFASTFKVEGPLNESASLVRKSDGTLDCILELLQMALDYDVKIHLDWGKLSSLNSPVVWLVLPNLHGITKISGTGHVRVLKIVVDAILQVLSWIGCEKNRSKKNSLYQMLLQSLFQNFGANCDGLEVPHIQFESGIRQPLLSEEQAKGFVRSRDTILMKAGLSVLSLEAKLEICKDLGFSSMSASALLEDINSFPETSLKKFLLSKCEYSRKQIQSSLRLLLKLGGTNYGRLSRVIEQLSSADESSLSQEQLMSPSVYDQSSSINKLSPSPGQLITKTSSSTTIPSLTYPYYPEFSSETGQKFKDNSRDNVFKAKMGQYPLNTTITAEEVEKTNYGGLTPMGAAFQKLNKMSAGEAVSQEDASKSKEMQKVMDDTFVNEIRIGKGCAAKTLLSISPKKFEIALRHFVHSRLSYLWEGSEVEDGHKLLIQIVMELLDILQIWCHRHVKTAHYVEQTMLTHEEDFNAKVAFSGSCGLLTGFFEFLDPGVICKKLFTALLTTPLMVDMIHHKDLSEWMDGLNEPSCLALALISGLHKTSWTSLWDLTNILLTSYGQKTNRVDPCPLTKESTLRFWESQSTDANFYEEIQTGEVVEFISSYVNHPCTTLACRTNYEAETVDCQKPVKAAFLPPVSAHVLTGLAVAEVASISIRNSIETIKETSAVGHAPHIQADSVDTLSKKKQLSKSMVLEVLVSLVCQGALMLDDVVHQLHKLLQELTADKISSNALAATTSTLKKAAESAVLDLLQGLYSKFPVSVGNSMKSDAAHT